MPRNVLALGSLCLLLLCSCDWDITQFVLHPDVDVRVRQSIALPAPAPPAVRPDSFSFAVFSDLHVGNAVRNYLAEYRRHADSLGIAFCCLAGDITHSALPAEFDSARTVLDALGPHYVTLGNHDLFQRGAWDEFVAHFGPGCYAVTAGRDVGLIFLDTAEGTLGAAQFAWLEDRLHAAAPRRTVVITHFPLYDGDRPGVYRLASGPERARLQSLLQRHGVYAIVSGHIHGWRHTEIEGVHHFIIGTITDNLDYGAPGYLLFTFAHDSLSWQHVEF